MKRRIIGVLIMMFISGALNAEASYWTKMSGSSGSFPLFPDGRLYKVQTLNADTFVAIGTFQNDLFDFNYRFAFKSTDGGETVAPIYDGADYVPGFLCRGLLKINDIHFVDQSNGMLLGGWGGTNCGGMLPTSENYVAYTSDGGNTWGYRPVTLYNSNVLFYGAGFTDRNHAFALGAANNPWKTDDSGVSWTRMTPAYQDYDAIEYHSVSAPTLNDIYAAGEWFNPDTWTDDDWGGPLEDDWGQKAYPDLNSTRGALIRSSDGGISWDYLLSTDDLSPPFQYNVGFHKVQFIGSNGWLLAVNSAAQLVDLMFSTDGGETWQNASLPPTYVGGPGRG
jgi:hypothetical protein